MDLTTFIADPLRAEDLAAKCGTSAAWLWQIANNWRGKRAGLELAQKIEQATGGIVTKESLRPDVWARAAHSIESSA